MYSVSIQDSTGCNVYNRKFSFGKNGDVGHLTEDMDQYLNNDPMFKKTKITQYYKKKSKSSSKKAIKSQKKFNKKVNSSVKPLSGMTLTKYGKGYLMHCDEDHHRYGQKYFYSAWWMPTQNAWFLKSEFYDKMINLGAKSVDIPVKSTKSKSRKSNSSSSQPLSGMTLSSYGKGYLLHCDEDHYRYGQKYFYSAWWMPTQNAWFLKSEFYDKMINLGATPVDEDDSELPYSGMTLNTYGKGYLMHCDEDNELWGTKYLEDNVWWNSRQDAWFVKESALDSVLEKGATWYQ